MKIPLSGTVTLLCVLLSLFLAGGCSSRVSTQDIRAGLGSPEGVTPLREEMEEAASTHEDDLIVALNLARLYQLEGDFRRSIAAYDHALAILEAYEARAQVNVRGMAASAGTYLLSRGAGEYFGTGYERSLLHTMNALNYTMLGDFTGAAVEARKMERRQELWLAEMEERIAEHVREQAKLPEHSTLPAQYSMRRLLENPEVRALVNGYQEPFSYVLSGILNRLAENPEYAAVSMGRAVALAPDSAALFREGWGPGRGTETTPGRTTNRATDQTTEEDEPGFVRTPGGNLKNTRETAKAASRPAPRRPATPAARRAAAASRAVPAAPPLPSVAGNDLEITVIHLSGLAPALTLESVRIPFPYVGYIMVDLPSFIPPLSDTRRITVQAQKTGIDLVPLLYTDYLAYRTLRDEVGMETTAAFSRALIRAGTAVAARAALAANEDTAAYADLGGLGVTLILDAVNYLFSSSVRNWELLPERGAIGMARVPKGITLTIRLGSLERDIPLPDTARGAIVLINQPPNNSLRTDYVIY